MPNFNSGASGFANFSLVALTTILCGCGASAGNAAAPINEGKIVSASELAKAVDLTKLPVPKGGEFNDRTAASISGQTPLSVKAAAEFYQQALEKQGFKVSDLPTPMQITPEYASGTFVKDGYSVWLSTSPGSDNKTMVMLIRYGDYDARKLPQSKDAEPGYGSSNLKHYVAKGSVAEEYDFLMKELKKQGWQQYVAPHTSYVEDPDQRRVMLRNQGYRLDMSVGKAPAQQNRTMVQYQLFTLANELPAPADATDVEYRDDDHFLHCKIPGKREVAEKYYLEVMPKLGNKAWKHDEPVEKYRILRFESPEKGIYLVNLTNEDGQQTKVEFLYYSPELLKKMRDSEGKPAEKPAADEPTEETPKRKPIFAKLLPLPKKTNGLKFDADSQSIQFRSGEAVPALVKSMKKSFEAADWKELPGSTTSDANAGAMVLQKEDALLTFVLINTGLGDGTTVIINANGLDWSEANAEKD